MKLGQWRLSSQRNRKKKRMEEKEKKKKKQRIKMNRASETWGILSAIFTQWVFQKEKRGKRGPKEYLKNYL